MLKDTLAFKAATSVFFHSFLLLFCCSPAGRLTSSSFLIGGNRAICSTGSACQLSSDLDSDSDVVWATNLHLIVISRGRPLIPSILRVRSKLTGATTVLSLSRMHCGDVDVTMWIGYMILQPLCVRKIRKYWSTSSCVAMKGKLHRSRLCMDFPLLDITLCSVDWLILFNRLPTNKICNTSVLRTFSEQDNVFSDSEQDNSSPDVKKSPHWIVFIGSSAASATCKSYKVLNTVEVHMHEKSNKNQMRGWNKSYHNGIAVYLHFPTICWSYYVE